MNFLSEPLVSVVTPSYNSAAFLDETIRSVLSQDYPNLEYIVMDGGSTDGSLEILRRYGDRLRFESAPDRGQCDAVNRGFQRSHGQIFAFLCADDTYLPGAVRTAVWQMHANPECAGVYGEGYLTDEDGTIVRPYPTRDFDPELFKTECFICQPAAFLWRGTFADVGMLDPSLRNGLDYDLWIRIARHKRMLRVPDFLATSRMHRGAKTLRERRSVYWNAIRIVKRHFGYVPYCHIYGLCCSLLDNRDGFYEPVPPSLSKYALSLAFGSAVNVRHPWRFWKEALVEGSRALRRGAWPPRA